MLQQTKKSHKLVKCTPGSESNPIQGYKNLFRNMRKNLRTRDCLHCWPNLDTIRTGLNKKKLVDCTVMVEINLLKVETQSITKYCCRTSLSSHLTAWQKHYWLASEYHRAECSTLYSLTCISPKCSLLQNIKHVNMLTTAPDCAVGPRLSPSSVPSRPTRNQSWAHYST